MPIYIIDEECYNIVDTDRNSVFLSFLARPFKCGMRFMPGKTGWSGLYYEVIPSRSLTAREPAAKVHLEYVAPHTQVRIYVLKFQLKSPFMIQYRTYHVHAACMCIYIYIYSMYVHIYIYCIYIYNIPV